MTYQQPAIVVGAYSSADAGMTRHAPRRRDPVWMAGPCEHGSQFASDPFEVNRDAVKPRACGAFIEAATHASSYNKIADEASA